jgi:hypothetical protein
MNLLTFVLVQTLYNYNHHQNKTGRTHIYNSNPHRLVLSYFFVVSD